MNQTPIPTAEELVARARAMVPTLQARAPQAAAARCLSAETIAEFHEAGFFRMLQPARWGGLEVHPNTFFDVQMTLAAACPASAWVLGVVAVHNWQLALFDEQAQQDVWSADSTTLISSSYMPVGTVVPVEGGYELSGTWGFSSGSDHCGWAFLGAFVPTESGQPDMRTFLVPRSDYEIVDDWHVLGLQGTGSKSVRIERCFVPEHRTHRFADGFRQQSPGNALNTAPLYRLPFGQIFVRSVSTSAIGIAQGALDAFVTVQSARVARGDGARVADDAGAQLAAARAAHALDQIRLVLARNFDELMGYCERGEKIPLDRRIQFRFSSSEAVEQCTRVVDDLFTASGGSAVFLSNPILRFFCDIHTARAHHANNPTKPGRNLGATMLGARNTDYFI
ncbi:MAG: flavin-dependent monooxygenase [Myxococcales bacterium]|nr:flavin-dependent monooxygenase [Myxococcales bacterium]MCB9531967.1 flavin-dependent monooxygenase [Myxococcales bacterium]MCB9532820.1 flavin-dependent monooxygenase [Myxococcales bacterium]